MRVFCQKRMEYLANRPWFTKLKPFNLVLTITNLLVDLYIHSSNFSCQMLERIKFPKVFSAKLSYYMVDSIKEKPKKIPNENLIPHVAVHSLKDKIETMTTSFYACMYTNLVSTSQFDMKSIALQHTSHCMCCLMSFRQGIYV